MSLIKKKLYKNDNSFLDASNTRKRIFYVVLISCEMDIKPSDNINLIKVHVVKRKAYITQDDTIGATRDQYEDAISLAIEFIRDNNLKTEFVSLEKSILDNYFLSEDGYFTTKKKYNEITAHGITLGLKEDSFKPRNKLSGEITDIAFYGKKVNKNNEIVNFIRINLTYILQLRNSIILINHDGDGPVNVSLEVCFNSPHLTKNSGCLELPRFFVSGNKKIDKMNFNIVPGDISGPTDTRIFNALINTRGFNLREIPDSVKIISMNDDTPPNEEIELNAIIFSLNRVPNRDVLFDMRIGENKHLGKEMHRIIIRFLKGYDADKIDDYKRVKPLAKLLKTSENTAQRIIDIYNADYLKLSEIKWFFNNFCSLDAQIRIYREEE